MNKVQFNLLPSSKTKVMAARHEQNRLTGQALKIALVCFGIFAVLLVYTQGIQRAQLSLASSNIKSKSAQIKKSSNLNTVLTVENQLQTAASLHQSQHVSSRLFDYLAKVTPLNASVSAVNLDMAKGTIKLDGSANSATTTNAFIDALKTAQFQVGSASPQMAFSQVVETNFALTANGVTYSISFNFNPTLFSNANSPTLDVPNSTTVHANDPGGLFGGTQ